MYVYTYICICISICRNTYMYMYVAMYVQDMRRSSGSCSARMAGSMWEELVAIWKLQCSRRHPYSDHMATYGHYTVTVA